MSNFKLPSNLYVAPGLLDKYKKENYFETDEKALQHLKEHIVLLKNNYQNKNFSLIQWSKSDRICVKVALANYLLTGNEQDQIFNDIEISDNLIASLPALLSFSVTSTKLHNLISRAENFIEKLSERNRATLGDILQAMTKWLQEGLPATMSANDQVLSKILDEVKEKIPKEVNPKFHVAFLCDRFDKLNKIRVKL